MPLPIDAPVCFIPVDDIGGADLVAQILVESVALTGGGVAESHGRSRHEGHAEKPGEPFSPIAVRELHLVAQVHGSGLADRSDPAVSQFVIRGLEDIAAASRTVGHLMYVFGDPRARLQDDILLELDMGIVDGGEALRLAVGAEALGRHHHGAADASINDGPSRNRSRSTS